MRSRMLWMLLIYLVSSAASASAQQNVDSVIAIPVRIVGDSASIMLRNTKEMEDAEHDAADLLAQQKAADAAEASVVISRQQLLWSKVQFVLGLLTAGAVLLSLKWTRDALVISEQANQINKIAMVTANRAWIISRLEFKTNLAWEGSGSAGSLSANIIMTHTNIGETPALDVRTNVGIVANFQNASELGRRLCRELEDEGGKSSRLVLPGESYNRPWAVSLNSKEIEENSFGSSLLPAIVVAISYKIVNDDSTHFTVLCYSIATHEGFVSTTDTTDVMDIEIEAVTGGFAT